MDSAHRDQSARALSVHKDTRLSRLISAAIKDRLKPMPSVSRQRAIHALLEEPIRKAAPRFADLWRSFPASGVEAPRRRMPTHSFSGTERGPMNRDPILFRVDGTSRGGW